MKEWTKPSDIRLRLESKWKNGDILRNRLDDGGLFPFQIKLKGPTTAELSSKLGAIIKWIEALRAKEKKKNEYGYKLIEKEVNFRSIGRNTIPTHAVVEGMEDALRLINKLEEVERFRAVTAEFLSIWADNVRLRQWILRYPFKILNSIGEDSAKFIAVIQWFENNPEHYMYIRQLDIAGVDTKFIEKNQSVLGELLEIILPEREVDIGKRYFEDRFYLKRKPLMVRFRILDRHYKGQEFRDITIPLNEFAIWDNNIENVFFTENEINFLSFPELPDSMVIFGKGYGATLFREVAWLQDRKVYYWGDIDTHGFNILGMARGFLPHLKSILMTEEILLEHRQLWVTEDKKHMADIGNLTEEEEALAVKLQEDYFGVGVRLEQERIGFNRVRESLEQL